MHLASWGSQVVSHLLCVDSLPLCPLVSLWYLFAQAFGAMLDANRAYVVFGSFQSIFCLVLFLSFVSDYQ